VASGGANRSKPARGQGYCSSVLATFKPQTRATLLDFDAEPLALAAARDGRLALVKGDLYRLPFSDETFDPVLNSSTMEHFDSFAAACGEVVRVTRRGGWLFVGVPYRYGPFLPFTLVPSRHPVSAWMGTLVSSPELREACRTSGVVVEDSVRYFGGCFLGLLMRRETGR
jgi:ubiquinone/menaquinone biosynthesis C-methylase UbiE